MKNIIATSNLKINSSMHIPKKNTQCYDLKMSTIKDIRHKNLMILLEKHKSKKAFAEVCELSPAHVSQLANKTRGIGDSIARKIEEHHPETFIGWMDKDHENEPDVGIKLNALLDHIIKKLPRNIDPAQLSIKVTKQNKDGYTELELQDKVQPAQHAIPILDHVQAGNFTSIGFDEAGAINYELVSDDLKDCFGLIIKGDSMEPTLKEGMTVYIRPQSTAEIGNIVIAQINGDTEATIKRYKKDAGTIYLVPDNKEYDSIKITAENHKDCKIIGVVVSARINF